MTRGAGGAGGRQAAAQGSTCQPWPQAPGEPLQMHFFSPHLSPPLQPPARRADPNVHKQRNVYWPLGFTANAVSDTSIEPRGGYKGTEGSSRARKATWAGRQQGACMSGEREAAPAPVLANGDEQSVGSSPEPCPSGISSGAPRAHTKARTFTLAA